MGQKVHFLVRFFLLVASVGADDGINSLLPNQSQKSFAVRQKRSESDFNLDETTGQGYHVPASENECGLSTNHLLTDEKSGDSWSDDSSRINSYQNEFPWTVQIMKDGISLCAGALIEVNVVITAAHCVDGIVKKTLKVRAGAWNIAEEDPKYPSTETGVKTIEIHGSYRKLGKYYDVALLQLEKELDVVNRTNIRKLCYKGNITRECYATGWGARNGEVGGPNQNIMKRVKMEILTADACEEALRTTNLGQNFELSNTALCAKGIWGDTEVGDGGGPLFCKEKAPANKMKRFILVGITSWGVPPEDYPGKPGVYTAYHRVHGWVKKIVSRYSKPKQVMSSQSQS